MLAKIENVFVKVSKEYSSNKTQKAFRKMEVSSGDRFSRPLSLFVDEAHLKNLPNNLSLTDDTEYDDPYNVIVNLNVGRDGRQYINFFSLEKI